MPNPTHSAVHVDTPLTNISVAHWQANEGKYRAFSIFPMVGVMKQSDKYYQYNKADLLRSAAQPRAPGAEVATSGYRVSTDSYLCERVALGRDIDDPTRDNADPQFDLDAEATEYLTDQIALKAETDWVNTFFASSKWSGDTDQTGVSGSPGSNQFVQFNDVTSDPIGVLRARITNVESGTGTRPNKLVLGPAVWDSLADHPDLLDRIKHTQTGVVAPSLLAAILELDEVVVLRAVVNSALEGQDDSTDFIAGKSALLLYVTPNPGLRTPNAGYTFVWTASNPLQGARIKRYRIERNEADRIEAEKWWDFKTVSADLGAFLGSAVA